MQNFYSLAWQASDARYRPSPDGSNPIVLVEINHFFSHHCALPQILRALRTRGHYRFIPYIPLFTWDVSHETLLMVLRFYQSMGIEDKVVKAENTAAHFEHAKAIADAQVKKFQGSIWDLTDFEFDGLPLGVHIVEDILIQAFSAEPALDQRTVAYAVGLIARYLWWKDYLASQPVELVIGSHLCYEFALPQLAAMRLGIASYAWTENALNTSGAFLPLPIVSDSWFESIRNDWVGLSSSRRSNYIGSAKDELQARAAGQRVGALKHDARFTQSKIPGDAVKSLKKSERPAVALYCHAFSDAPCTLPKSKFGSLCSPLVSTRRIFELCRDLPIDLYVKTHPNPFPHDDEALNQMLAQYPWVTRIPAGLTPSDLKESGVDAVISGWGSICFEATSIGLATLAYTDRLELTNLGIVSTFNLDDDHSLRLAISRTLGSPPINLEDERDRVAETYAITSGGYHDLTCSDMESLSREDDRGRYSPHAYTHWAATFDAERFLRIVPALARYFEDGQSVFSKFNEILNAE